MCEVYGFKKTRTKLLQLQSDGMVEGLIEFLNNIHKVLEMLLWTTGYADTGFQ